MRKTAKQTNGAASPVAKPITRLREEVVPQLPKFPPAPPREASDEEFRAWNLGWQRTLSNRRAIEITMPVTISVFDYGLLSECGLIHGCSPEEALQAFIDDTDCLTEWANEGFPLTGERTGTREEKAAR